MEQKLPRLYNLGRRRNPDVVYTEIRFSMDALSSAPHRVGAFLVPRTMQYFPRWLDRGNRSYVTLMVRSSVVEGMVAKVCAMHPSVRCISRTEVLPSTPGIQDAAS
jgi:hypothetical protein